MYSRLLVHSSSFSLTFVFYFVLVSSCNFNSTSQGAYRDGPGTTHVNDANPGQKDATEHRVDADIPDSTINPDASVPDASLPDASLPDASLPDASLPDASLPMDAPPPCVGDNFSFTMLNVQRCDPLEPTNELAINIDGTYRLNTNTGVLTNPDEANMPITSRVVTQSDGTSLFVLSVNGMYIASASSLTISGDHAVVIVSTDSLTIEGRINASNRIAPRSYCATGNGTNGVIQNGEPIQNEGGSGGGGGGFRTTGGQGASIAYDNRPSTEGGQQAVNQTLVPLRGGCPGGNGGGNGGNGGQPGGALQIIANSITLDDGTLIARGTGGRGVNQNTSEGGGGGGGGSGGGILLQCQTCNISANAFLSVNGGGGGAGHLTDQSSAAGEHGHLLNSNPALGGIGQSDGGSGGNGGTIMQAPTAGMKGNSTPDEVASGGGGGGAAGIIRIVDEP